MIIRVIDALLKFDTDIVPMTRFRIDNLRPFALSAPQLRPAEFIVLFNLRDFLQSRRRTSISCRREHLLHRCLLLQLRCELLFFLALHLHEKLIALSEGEALAILLTTVGRERRVSSLQFRARRATRQSL